MGFNKAQGALEYLLLISGAILISAVVVTLLITLGTGEGSYPAQAEHAFGHAFHELTHTIGGDEGTPTPCPNGTCEAEEDIILCPQDCCETSCNGVCQGSSCFGFDLDCDSSGQAIKECCGNNRIEGTEACDGTNLAGQDCITKGFIWGTLSCCSDCFGFNTSGCTSESVCGVNGCEAGENIVSCPQDCCETSCNGVCQGSSCFSFDPDCDVNGTSGGECCGNNRIEGSEVCDNQNTGTKDCTDFHHLGYTSGSLSCLPNCSDFDPTTCSTDPICGLYGCEPGECGPGTKLCLADCSMTDCCGNETCNLFIDDCTCSDCFGEQGPCPDGEICDSTGSGICIDATPPGNPTNLTAMAGDTQARLDWTNPSDSDLAGLMIRYTIEPDSAPTTRLEGSQATNCSGYSIVPGATTNCILNLLINETQYNYSIFARDEVPNYSSAASVSVTPLTSTCNDNLTCEPGETCFCPDCEGETGTCLGGKKCQAGSCEFADSDCDGGFPNENCNFPLETCSCSDCEDSTDPCPSGQGCHNGACEVIDLDCIGGYENGVLDSGEECDCGDHQGCKSGQTCCPPCAVSCYIPIPV